MVLSVVLLDRPAEEGELPEEIHHPLHVEPPRVVRGVGLAEVQPRVAFGEVLVVVEVPLVRVDAEEVPHVLGAQHLLLGDQGLEELLAVARPDVLGLHVRTLKPEDRLGEGADGRGRGLLDEEVALLAVLEGVEDEVHRVVEGHHEARHVGVRDGDGLPLFDLLEEERDHGAPRGHDVAVARQAEHRVAREELAASGHHVLLHEGLGHPHRVDGVGGLVGA